MFCVEWDAASANTFEPFNAANYVSLYMYKYLTQHEQKAHF